MTPSAPLRVLFISNISAPRCGVAEYGRIAAEQLRAVGVEVTEWDGHYPAIYEKPYLPADAASYDVIHVNWHPVTLNHYRPEHLPAVKGAWSSPRRPILSLFLHDLPPWSTCDLVPYAAVCFAAEAHPQVVHLPYPALVDATVAPDRDYAQPVVLGWSGVRGDGRAALQEICRRRGWALNDGDGDWRGTRKEILRLSQSTLNVLWYQASGRGQSLALMTAAAARRPLLINDSSMFASARGWEQEIYRAGHHPVVPLLEPAIDAVLQEIWQRRERRPDRFLGAYSWPAAAQEMVDRWTR